VRLRAECQRRYTFSLRTGSWFVGIHLLIGYADYRRLVSLDTLVSTTYP
jgi:hypothetical protein